MDCKARSQFTCDEKCPVPAKLPGTKKPKEPTETVMVVSIMRSYHAEFFSNLAKLE